MAKIDVCGVAHIDPETEKVSGYLNERIDEGALVFLEPTLEMLTDPSTIAIYHRFFWKSLANISVEKGKGVVPISYERMPRMDQNSYVNDPHTGIPEPRYGIALLLEEQLQSEWIDRKMTESDYGVVIIGDDHAENISEHLKAKGHESTYDGLMEIVIPEARCNREIKEFVQGKREEFVRLSWEQRATNYVVEKVKDFFQTKGVSIIENSFHAIMTNPQMVKKYFDFCRDLMHSPELVPKDDEKLYQGCSVGMDTHRMMIEMMNINPIKNLVPPTLTKKEIYKA